MMALPSAFAAVPQPEPGTPVALVVHPLLQNLDAVTPGLTRCVGVNVAVAQRIALDTGDRICWPFATVGFVDVDLNSIALAIHGSVPDGKIEISVVESGLRWSRPIFDFVWSVVFGECGASELVMRVSAADTERRATLERLGFQIAWRARQRGRPDRLTYSLAPSDIPPAFRRARRRRSH